MTATIGHNGGPLDPFDALKSHIDDLYDEAVNYLDGATIETQEVADDVGRIMDAARKAMKEADDQRKSEAAPFDLGKKEVQAKWTPLSDKDTGRCALIVKTAQRALVPFLQAQQTIKDAEATAARVIADKAAADAREAYARAGADLKAQQDAEDALAVAAKADAAAKKIDGARAQVAGSGRAISTRTRHIATLTDAGAALRWFRDNRPDLLKAFLRDEGQRECAAGNRNIDGYQYTTETTAQ